MADSELDRLDPEASLLTLSNGLELEVVRLRTRQFFRLLKILTHGAGPALMQSGLDFNADPEQFGQSLLMLVVMSIPDAEQAAIGFLQSMCQPAGLAQRPGKKATKQEEEDDQALWESFNRYMFNPPLEDTIDLIEQVILKEAPELQSLGKKLKKMLEMFSKTGQAKEPPEPEPSQQEMAESSSPEPSPPSSTSSATSTDGQTSTSSTSRSAASGKRSRQQAAAVS